MTERYSGRNDVERICIERECIERECIERHPFEGPTFESTVGECDHAERAHEREPSGGRRRRCLCARVAPRRLLQAALSVFLACNNQAPGDAASGSGPAPAPTAASDSAGASSNAAEPQSLVRALSPAPQGDVIEAGCSYSGSELRRSLGGVFRVSCPAGCASAGGSIWGSGTYTADSSVCKSALHAGAITDAGGIVTIQIEPGRPAYRGSVQNGIHSRDYGSYGGSFSVLVPSPPPGASPPAAPAVAVAPGAPAVAVAPAAAVASPPPRIVDVAARSPSAADIPPVAQVSGRVALPSASGAPAAVVPESASPVVAPSAAAVASARLIEAGCSYDAGELAHAVGAVFRVSCPAGCGTSSGSIWGSGTYTTDSPVCKSAIHAGAIAAEGGVVAIQIVPGRPAYRGSTRNGLESKDYGNYRASFTVLSGSPSAASPTAHPRAPRGPLIEAGCSYSGNSLEGEVGDQFQVSCPAGCGGGSVWGTDVYTADSPVCSAAIHAGAITAVGGTVLVQLEPGRPAYRGSHRNGITTSDYDGYHRSFRIVR